MNNVRVTAVNYGQRTRFKSIGQHVRVQINGWRSELFLIKAQHRPFRGWFCLCVKI